MGRYDTDRYRRVTVYIHHDQYEEVRERLMSVSKAIRSGLDRELWRGRVPLHLKEKRER